MTPNEKTAVVDTVQRARLEARAERDRGSGALEQLKHDRRRFAREKCLTWDDLELVRGHVGILAEAMDASRVHYLEAARAARTLTEAELLVADLRPTLKDAEMYAMRAEENAREGWRELLATLHLHRDCMGYEDDPGNGNGSELGAATERRMDGGDCG
jgi:hypothetical protein